MAEGLLDEHARGAGLGAARGRETAPGEVAVDRLIVLWRDREIEEFVRARVPLARCILGEAGELGVGRFVGERASLIASNDAQRARLLDLLDRITSADLEQRLPNGNSVADILIHLAFWDHYTCEVLRMWQREGFSSSITHFEALNSAVLMLASAIPSAAAVGFVREAAESVDREAAGIPRDLAGTIIENRKLRSLERAQHRREHLDQIAGLLGGA
jgi:hypothetical protein